MKHSLIFICILIFNCKFSLSQLENDSTIFWSDKRILKYTDFKGKIPKSSSFKAGTCAEIYIKGFIEDGLPNFTIVCSFDKKKSWIKDTSIELLRHEQLHFDIAELFSRKLRKGILELRNNYEIEIESYDKLIQEALKTRIVFEDYYDQETAHGIYLNKQREWNEKIKKELEELIAYKIDYEVLF